MTDRSGNNHTRAGDAEGRRSRRNFLSHVAPASVAAAAAVGIGIAVDQDAPERARPIERTRLTILPGAGLVYNVLDYGAQGDGQTDDATAVQSAINAALHKGGTVYFPAGTYVIGKTLVCDENAAAFTLCGAGGGMQGNTTPSVLLYTGSAGGPSGGLLTFNSSFGFEVCHLAFNYNNAAFRGDLINIDGGPHAADSQDFHIHHCSGKGVRAPALARSIVRLNKAVIGTISHCGLGVTAGNAIRIGDPGGSYVNAFQVEKCTFNFNANGHILLGTADGESIVIRDCTFEAGIRTTGIRGATRAVDGGDNALYSPVIECCWFGDAGAPTTWIDGLNVQSNAHNAAEAGLPPAGYTGTIRGCRFASTVGGTHLRLQGAWLVEANSFEDGTVYAATTPAGEMNLVAIANLYNKVTTLFHPSDFPEGSPSAYVSLGNTGAHDVLAGNKLLAGANPTPAIQVQDAMLGLFDTAPAAQPKAAGTTSGFAPGAGQAVDSAATFTGGVGTSAYTIGDIVKALKQIGAIAT